MAQDAEHWSEGLCSEGLRSNPNVWCPETDYNGGHGSRTWSWLQGRHGVLLSHTPSRETQDRVTWLVGSLHEKEVSLYNEIGIL